MYFKSKMLILVSLILIGFSASWSENLFASAGVIVIRAPKSQSTRVESGRRDLIRPANELESDSKIVLEKNASIQSESNGSPSSNGSILPRVRHQSERQTEIWLGDVQVFDPYSGLSSSSLAQIGFFGAMEFHRGISHYRIPTTNPIGVIRYQPVFIRKEKAISAKVGDIYGRKLAGAIGFYEKLDNWTLAQKFYTHSFGSSGTFPFYDDTGTPYNSSDDRISSRKSNSQLNDTFASLTQLQFKESNCQLLGINDFLSGELSGPVGAEWDANLLRKTSFADIGCRYHNKNIQVSGGTNYREELFRTKDPKFSITPGVSVRRNHLESSGQRISAEHISKFFKLKAAIKIQDSLIKNSINNSHEILNQVSKSTFLGIQFKPLPRLSSDLKIKQGDLEGFSKENRSSKRKLEGSSLSLAYRLKRIVSYIQYGFNSRPPTLLELLGDGINIQSNLAIDNEEIEHKEAGLKYRHQNGEIVVSLFQDLGSGLIAIVPASFGASKAINLNNTEVRGVEFDGSYSLDRHYTFSLGLSKFNSFDYSNSKQLKTIPNSPDLIGVYSFLYSNDFVYLSYWGRYQSSVYRDPANSILVGDQLINNFSVNWKIVSKEVQQELGLSVLNVFDNKSTSIKTIGGIERAGRTARASFFGYPLPGRSILVSFSQKF